jgi:hypothetical protein
VSSDESESERFTVAERERELERESGRFIVTERERFTVRERERDRGLLLTQNERESEREIYCNANSWRGCVGLPVSRQPALPAYRGTSLIRNSLSLGP